MKPGRLSLWAVACAMEMAASAVSAVFLQQDSARTSRGATLKVVLVANTANRGKHRQWGLVCAWGTIATFVSVVFRHQCSARTSRDATLKKELAVRAVKQRKRSR